MPAGPMPAGRWGAAAVLPWLFLQLTLLANVGRLESLGGWDVPVAVLVAGAGVALAGLALMTWTRIPRRPAHVIIGVVTAALLWAGSAGGSATVLLLPAQAGLAILLRRALVTPTPIPWAPGDPGRPSFRPARTWLATAIGGVLFFALLFTLYADALDGFGPVVWPAAALVVGLAGLSSGASFGVLVLPRRLLGAPAELLAVVLIGTAIGALPAGGAIQPRQGAAATALTVLDANIHQGFGRDGVPGLERTLDVLRAANADIITLQEVPRVWDLSGGVDAFAWLRDRLPEYHAVYGPTSRARFGNAIFVRTNVRASGFEWFPFGPSRDQRGFAWAEMETTVGPLLVVTMHMTPYSRADEITERDQQAGILLDVWAAHGQGLAIFAGDYNSEPDDPAYRRTVAGGLVDALASAGIGSQATYRSTGTPFLPAGAEKIDYVFVSPGIATRSAEIVGSDASDHYPVRVRLALGPG